MSKIVKVIVGAVLVVVGFITGNPYLITTGLQLFASGVIAYLIKTPTTSMEAGKVNVRLSEPQRWLCGGEVRQGGGIMFAEFDTGGNLWYLITHCDSRLTEVIKYYLDDVPVTLDGSGMVITDEFCLTPDKKLYTGTGTKVPYIQITTTTYSETDPTPPAITALQAAFPIKWTSDHKLVGTTYTVVKMNALDIENRAKLYRWRGSLGMGEPALSVVGKWSAVYDPRDNTQTLGDPTTYKHSRNAILIWAWFRMHQYGRRKPADSINWDRVAEQADLCAAMVSGIYGDTPRYNCDTAIPDDRERASAELEIISAMDGQLVFDDDGKCWVRIGYYDAPTLHLSRNRDIVAMESIEGQNIDNETQGVIVRYIEPLANYTVQPSAAWLNPNFYVDGMVPSFIIVDIFTIQNHNQAMRIAKSIGYRAQPLHKLAPTTGLRGLKARQERIIDLNYDNTFSGDYEIITPVEVDLSGQFCGFAVVPVDENRWKLLTGEEKPRPVINEADIITTLDMPTGVSVLYNNGRIEVTFNPAPRDDVRYEFQYIPVADVAGNKWSDMIVSMFDTFAYGGVVSQSINYYVRWRTVSGSGLATEWSDPVTLNGFGPPTEFSGVSAGLDVNLQWRNPVGTFDHLRYFRGTTTVFADAVPSANISGGLGEVMNVTDTVGAIGTYYYWIAAFNLAGDISSKAGPIQIDVSSAIPYYFTSTLGL